MKKSIIFLCFSALILFSCKNVIPYNNIASGGAGQVASVAGSQINYTSQPANTTNLTTNLQIMDPVDDQVKEIFRILFGWGWIPGPGWIQFICVQQKITITITKWIKTPCPGDEVIVGGGESGSGSDGHTTVPRSALTPENATHASNIEAAVGEGFYNPDTNFYGSTLINIAWDPRSGEPNPFLGDGMPLAAKQHIGDIVKETTEEESDEQWFWGPCPPLGPGTGGGTTGTGGWVMPYPHIVVSP